MTLPAEKTLHDALLVPLSRQIAAAINAQPFYCTVNAWRTLIEFPALFRQGGCLVEGWFVIEEEEHVTLNEHMWCELANGQIVDPSVLLLVPETTPVFYFAGLTRDYAETEALEGELFPHVRADGLHGKDGLGHPEYKEARAAARRKAYALALARKPPKALQFLTAREMEAVSSSENEPGSDLPVPVIEGAPMDIPLSLQTSNEIQAVAGRCWYNARQALFEMPNVFWTALYIEGWTVGQWPDAIRVMEHGWLWSPQTGIVDPTIVLDAVPTRLVYLPGVQLSWMNMLDYREAHLPLARVLGLGALEYQHACHTALARAEELAWQTGLPILIEPGAVHVIRVEGNTLLLAERSWEFPAPSLPPGHQTPDGLVDLP